MRRLPPRSKRSVLPARASLGGKARPQAAASHTGHPRLLDDVIYPTLGIGALSLSLSSYLANQNTLSRLLPVERELYEASLLCVSTVEAPG